MRRILYFILVLFCLSSCSKLEVKIINNSAQSLDDTVVIVQSSSTTFGNITSGAEKLAEISPGGESSVSIKFLSNGKLYNHDCDLYFEPGYSGLILITIDNSLAVKCDGSQVHI